MDINARSEALLDYLATTELKILNRGSTSTFYNTLRSEVIDITFGLGSLPPRIENWRISDESSLSVTDQILFDLRVWSESGRTLFRNEKRTDWSTYRIRLQELVRPRMCKNLLDIEEAALDLTLAAFQESYPLTVKHKNIGGLASGTLILNTSREAPENGLIKPRNRAVRRTGLDLGFCETTIAQRWIKPGILAGRTSSLR